MLKVIPFKPKKHISTDYWIALYNQCADPNLLRILAKEIPTTTIFEDHRKGLISSEEAATIIMAAREPSSWFLRFLNSIFGRL